MEEKITNWRQNLTLYLKGTALKENLTKQCQILTLNIEANNFGKNSQLVPDFDFQTSLSSFERKFHHTVPDSNFPAGLSSFERKISQTVPDFDFHFKKVYIVFP